jgi:fluoride exporter
VRAIVVGLAGFAGAVSRYAIGTWLGRRSTASFPWATFAINVSGCLALGFLMALFTGRWVPNPDVRAALTVGFLGAFTTFSTFAYETVKLGEDGSSSTATAYVVASVGVGIAAAWLGTVAGRHV